MKYKLHIPFLNRSDLLLDAVASVASTFPDIHIWADGIVAPVIPGTTAHALPPVSFAGMFNHFIQSSWDDDVMLFMHSDAVALNGAAAKFLEFVKDKFESDDRWGIILTSYDALAAYNMKAIRSIGYMDPMFYLYVADDDQLHRFRMAGWSIVDSGLLAHSIDSDACGVFHHTSSSVKSDRLFHDRISEVNKFSRQYFDMKWKPIGGDHRCFYPFNARHLSRLLVNTPLLSALSEDTRAEGNLFDAALKESDLLADRDTLSQLNTMYDTITMLQPRRILEVGTNKGYFGYLLTLLLNDFDLLTLDGDPRSARAAELLGPRVRFRLGDSKITLPTINEEFDLAWIDGGHDFASAFADITNAMRLNIPVIMIDDMEMPHTPLSEVKVAVEKSGLAQTHHIIEPYTYMHDHRRMVVATRKG